MVEEHSAALFRFVRSLVGDDVAAEDLVQETFLRAYQARDGYRGEASVRTWLRRIAHNLAVDRSRRDPEIPVEEVDEKWHDDAYTVDAEAVALRTESREELQDALVRLPFIYRSAVLLHDVEGWTMQEVADELGIGLPAAKQRLRRGRMQLVTALADGAERRQTLAGVPLRCWDARARVSDYLDDELHPDERAVLEAHLARCPICPPLYRGLVSARGALGALRDPDSVTPPGLAERVRGRLAGS